VINEIERLKFEGLTSKNDAIYTNIEINGPKLVQNVGVYLGNFQLHSFTKSKNIAKRFTGRGLLFWRTLYTRTHCHTHTQTLFRNWKTGRKLLNFPAGAAAPVQNFGPIGCSLKYW